MSLVEWLEEWKRRNPDADAEWATRVQAMVGIPELQVDFNDIDDGGRVMALISAGESALEVGTDAHLQDADGNYCRGTVTHVRERLVWLQPHWDTWWPGKAVPPDECPDRAKHRYPEGPNEDTGRCRFCGCPMWELRPDGETYGDHLPDCSLPRRHESYCQPGGAGHPRAAKIRGYFGRGIDEDADLIAVTAQGSVEIKGYWAWAQQ